MLLKLLVQEGNSFFLFVRTWGAAGLSQINRPKYYVSYYGKGFNLIRRKRRKQPTSQFTWFPHAQPDSHLFALQTTQAIIGSYLRFLNVDCP